MAITSSKRVSAGTRIYYFDTRTDNQMNTYITIAEIACDGKKRSCIYLHPEHFDKFRDALIETLNNIKDGKTD